MSTPIPTPPSLHWSVSTLRHYTLGVSVPCTYGLLGDVVVCWYQFDTDLRTHGIVQGGRAGEATFVRCTMANGPWCTYEIDGPESHVRRIVEDRIVALWQKFYSPSERPE